VEKTYNIKTTASSKAAVTAADVIILAVKPQDMAAVKSPALKFTAKQVVISILAGTPLSVLQQQLGHDRIIRAMPNMTAQIGESMTVWTAAGGITEAQKKLAKTILAACGEELYVASEKYIDMATAISGSGPAYTYLIIEALTDAGVHIGMPRATAEKLVIETMIASARSIKLMSRHPAEMKNMVTSPGGTTTDGLLQLETGGLRSLLLKAVIATYEKAKNMGAGK
jgi:pyrroline-5-carboxylate reductase